MSTSPATAIQSDAERAVTELREALDRLETRIDEQSARIDGLYRMLELRGIRSGRDASRARFRIGDATGV